MKALLSQAIKALTSYPREIGLVALLVTTVLGVRGYAQERDARIAAEAVAEERLEEFQASAARADSLHKLHVRTDSQVAVAQSHISRLRSEALRTEAQADSLARLATAAATEAGDSLQATIEAIHDLAIQAEAGGTLIPPEALKPLSTAARQQHRLERSAHRNAAQALRSQVHSLEASLSLADSTSSLWRRRYTSLEAAYEARGRALEDARESLEARAPSGDSGWSTLQQIAGGVTLLAVGYVAGAGL